MNRQPLLTAGLIPTLERALERFGDQIVCAFVYGSVARSQEHAASDVDLMAIGLVGLAELSPVLRKAESRLGREVNVTTYSAAEFREKVAAKDHFLSTVLRGLKQFVKGSQRDLEEVIGYQGDVVVTGTPREETLAEVMQELERQLGREISYTVLSRKELKSGRSRKDSFL